MEDDSNDLAFRRTIINVAQRLTDEDVRKIIYIRLYRQREILSSSATALDVLAALEHANVFSPAQPEGLLEILERDIKNRQLSNLVKGFIRDRNRKPRVSAAVTVTSDEAESEIESRLRMCYKIAISQSNVLVKHLEALRVATVVSKSVDEEAARTALKNVSEVAAALAKIREKADVEIKEASSSISEETYEDMEYSKETGEKEDKVEEEMIKHLPRVPRPLQQASKQKPPTVQLKPVLKPELKLNDPSQRAVTKTEITLESSRSASLPDLLDGAEMNGDEDEYIYPEFITEDMKEDIDAKMGQTIGKSRVLTKTISLPQMQQHKDTTISFRPLPTLPRGISRPHYEEVQGVYTSLDSAEENEPLYDDVNVNTLLSRMGKPRQDSSSSND